VMRVINHKRLDFACDHAGCDVVIKDGDVIAAGGLVAVGWKRVFDETDRKLKHYCPLHTKE
jgi:hypothetical protein